MGRIIPSFGTPGFGDRPLAFPFKSKTHTCEVKSKTKKIAGNATERTPEIGHLVVRVMENCGCAIELLRKTNAAPKAQTLALRPS